MLLLSEISSTEKTVRIDAASVFGSDYGRLPHIFRILVENVARNASSSIERDAAMVAIRGWLVAGRSSAEIAFQPSRVLMHDTTCTPALVDIAGMRDALAEAGGDPGALSPVLPVDVSVDHSLGVDVSAVSGAADLNKEREYRRNGERYRFLKWATQAMRGVRVNPPGTGIMHTINLEQLATVVGTTVIEGRTVAIPDTLIGTDSHTPMINGIGVLAWGVGGLEAESVMFGMPVMMRLPDVIGVRLDGRLREGVLATDLALTVTQLLRERGVTGTFVEFFGPGVSTLSAGERAVVANMTPEFGASTAFFPVDGRTLAYLRQTGRDERAVALVEAYARAQGLWFDADAEPRFTDTVALDLGTVETSLAGPFRPQDRLPLSGVPAALAALPQPAKLAEALPRHPVAIAAITSCTNTSDPRLLVAAGLVARKARTLGLVPPLWVKTSLAPGSPAAEHFLRRSGLLDDLEALGFGIVGYGCTTCIGNSGPLLPMMEQAVAAGETLPVAILSGNRNFPGRVHGQVEAGFLASPPLVIAYALAGDVTRDLTREPIGQAGNRAIHLSELWPSGDEIDAALAAGLDRADFRDAFARASADASWAELEAPSTPLFPWALSSTYLRRPPFARADAPISLGRFSAHPILVVGDDITTDHISPAGQTPASSEAGQWLIGHGESPRDLNVYASRRGNWEVMLRGLFTNRTVVNRLGSDLPPGSTRHAISGEVLPLWVAAERYRSAGEAIVIVAGERYGTGSSRDWAAKGLGLLGVRAVLAASFERIHRSNLIGMGILPLTFDDAAQSAGLSLRPGDRIEVAVPENLVAPRLATEVTLLRAGGERLSIPMHLAVETELECETLRAGGMLPLILRRFLPDHRDHPPGEDEAAERRRARVASLHNQNRP
ncbi:aconitate hydratase AcnA [Bosea sp. LjRoot90]|uniref:aconitate hydratase AcnA n=1 Tax=Bosea sp. LjRoot90 TaxID=3342342 RepID=UPI003ECF28BD